ncbi:MAG: hypothetical protein ACYDCC_03000 [Actinomycetota bacterium]
MRRTIAWILGATMLIAFAPHPSFAQDTCNVLSDTGGHVTGPLGTARPTPNAGREIDLTNVWMSTDAQTLSISVNVVDLSAKPTIGTSGAFYGVFWSVGPNRYFAQASRLNDDNWMFQAGPAVGESLPQQGQQIDGNVDVSSNTISMTIPRSSYFGSDQVDGMLEQVRASSEETAGRAVSSGQVTVKEVAATQDQIGGPDGGRYQSDSPCLPPVSGDGERCLVAVNPPHTPSTGAVPAAPAVPSNVVEPPAPPALPAPVPQGPDIQVQRPQTAVGSVDPATAINSVQMGSNPGTLVIEIGVGSLANPVPQGADAERWSVTWSANGIVYSAFAERHQQGPVFGYNDGNNTWPTTGSLDTDSATVRILVPRHEINADSIVRLTGVFAQSSIVVGPVQDVRDSAPATQQFGTQFIVGVACGDQEKSACPLIFDPAGESSASVNNPQSPDPENQPASDITAVGASAPDDTIVFSVRVANIGSDPPPGFDTQGWTVSWSYGGLRYIAQAERSGTTTKFMSGVSGPAGQTSTPNGADSAGSTKTATGSFDAQAQTISIVVPRADINDPQDGEALTDLGASAWEATTQGQAQGQYVMRARDYPVVDTTQIAPYRVGLACSA